MLIFLFYLKVEVLAKFAKCKKKQQQKIIDTAKKAFPKAEQKKNKNK